MEEFCKSATAKSGRLAHCKVCHRKHYENNKERIKPKQKEYREKNKEKSRLKSKERYLANKDSIKLKVKEYCNKNKEKVNLRKRQYAKENKERIKAYKAANRDKINLYVRNKLANDINFKLASLLRNRIRTALKRFHKNSSTKKLLGCSIEEFRAYFEAKFTDGMTWEIFLSGGEIHIDHIRPCSSFDLADPVQQSECFHYSNLQPLWAADNFKKSDSYPT